jgi:hypothetical protein
MAKTTAEKIMLGCGVVSVGGYPLGLTRGGSTFAVEREIRSIEADCDRGPVKGRVMIDTEVPKLTVNALEPFATDEIARYWPGLSLDSLNAAYDVVTGTLTIAAGDYNDISFVGKTKDGQAVTIEIDDAINLANIEWALEDKNEVVPSLEFTGHYDETTRTTPPWRVKFAKAESHTVTFTVSDTGGVYDGADVTLYGRTVTTNASGVAAFASIPEGTNYPFSVVAGGYETYHGAVTVDADEAVAVTITAIT